LHRLSAATAVITALFQFATVDAAVSRRVIKARLYQYSGDNMARETTLKRLFREAGCDHRHLNEQPVKDSKIPNVICMLPGTSSRFVIVGAHFDRAPEGDGVIDNWSGAALLTSLYEALKTKKRSHTYIFIGFTDEEHGAVGSRFYTKQMTDEEVSATDAMVNLDSLGLGPAKVWGGHSDAGLVDMLSHVATRLNMSLTNLDLEHVTTDAEQFAKRNIPRITIHSLFPDTLNANVLHTSKDKIQLVQFENYYETYSLLELYLISLDTIE
jgi:Iap family predicted aminopeptidase